jgi:hypothetical protein
MFAFFPLGHIVATLGALAALESAKRPVSCFPARHAIGNCDELDPSDVAENEYRIIHGFRLLEQRQTLGRACG